MTMWRIRIALPDDPSSHGALSNALAGQSVSGVRVLPGEPAREQPAQEQPGRTAATAAATSEIVVELPQDDGLASVLSALHEISPHVFVSRADVAAAEGESQRARYGVLSATATWRLTCGFY